MERSGCWRQAYRGPGGRQAGRHRVGERQGGGGREIPNSELGWEAGVKKKKRKKKQRGGPKGV